MATTQTAQPGLHAPSGTTRSFAVPSCVLQPDDLRRLYGLLDRRSREIADLSVARLTRQPGQTDEQLEQTRQYGRRLMQLVVTTQASDGSWSRAAGADVLEDSSLPDSLSGVVFDSGFMFREQTKSVPLNYVTVTLDFGRTRILDVTNLSVGPEPNASSVQMSSTNDTWVKALHDDLRTFFSERASNRSWLHSRYAYDVLLPVLGIPLSLNVVYYVSRSFGHALGRVPALAFPLYFIVFLYGLLGFRILFNYVRWTFPKVEGPSRKAWPRLHRAFIVLIGGGVVTFVLDGILRAIAFLR